MFLPFEPELAHYKIAVFDEADGFANGFLLAGSGILLAVLAEDLIFTGAARLAVELTFRRDFRELLVVDLLAELLFE